MAWDGSGPELALHRVRTLMVIVLAAVSFLIARLWWIQIACGEEYDRLSVGVRMRHFPMRAPRGLIYDRSGRLMAATTMEYIVVVDPMELRRRSAAERAGVFHRTASILGMSVEEIQDALDRAQNSSFDVIKLKSGLGPGIMTEILEHSSELPGIDVEQVPSRSYPMGALGAHILGYIGDVKPDDLQQTSDRPYNGCDQRGEQGLERSYEQDLRGIDGERSVEVNARGLPVSGSEGPRTDPVAGNSLILTLDSTLQQVCQSSFPEGFKGSVVAVDVHTGGILAMASRPGFDPNSFVVDTPEARKQRAAYLLDPAGPMQNRAIMSRYPPGSTFKLVTSAAGFAHDRINPGSVVDCKGGMHIGSRGQFKKCWSHHGPVNYLEAMARSCDTYFYDLMKRLTSNELAETSKQLGLGTLSGIDLPSEARGFIPTREWKDRRFDPDRWWFGDSCNMAIGQGFIQTTPLQMALVTAAVANGGEWLRPHLVQEVRSARNSVLRPIPVHMNGRLSIPEDGLRRIREGMLAAVEPGGTAGVVRFSDLAVAAKTGSAQDLPNPKTHAWFVCFAPYRKPQIAICVMVEHGGHGGQAAGPVARALLKAYFHLNDTSGATSRLTD